MVNRLVGLCLLFYACCVDANQAFINRPEVKRFIQTMVVRHHFKASELNRILSQVVIQPKIIESMEKPYEKKSWDSYRAIFLTQERLKKGLEFWRTHQQLLAKAEQYFEVPASIIVAIIGVETLYGKHQGNYRVLDALATLAFNYPKRAEFFIKELQQYLLLCRDYHISPTYYLGSYAGAIGKPQFMPSSYRNYATDFSNRIHKDLVNDDAAVIASVANYFYHNGWRKNQAVAEPALITGNRYLHINTSYRQARYPIKQLVKAGIKPVQTSLSSSQKAGLIALTTDKGLEHWLAYSNFYVITRYNTSPQYALAVYLLSEELRQNHLAQIKGLG